jgi:hypothetical protein
MTSLVLVDVFNELCIFLAALANSLTYFSKLARLSSEKSMSGFERK